LSHCAPSVNGTAAFGLLVTLLSASIIITVDGALSKGSQTPTDQSAVRLALDSGAYAEAVRLAERDSALALREHGPNSIETAHATNLHVEALLKDGRAALTTTLALAEGAVELTARLRGQHDLEYATSLSNLGTLRNERGEFRAALSLHERAQAIRVRSLARTDPAIADTLDNMALALIRLDRFAEATERLSESKNIRDTRKSEPLALARTLYLVALLHRQDGDFQAARTAIDQTLDIRRRMAPDHPDTALAIELQGDLLFFAGDWIGARRLWTEALDMIEKRLGPEHASIPRLLRWLANASKSLGDLGEARRLLDRARSVGQQTLASCHPESMALLNDSANLAGYEGKYSTQAALYAETLTVVERCLGPTHSLTATVVYNQGDLAFKMGDLDEADRLLSRAARLWAIGLQPDHPYVARALDARAEVASSRGQFAQARTLYSQALAMREKRLGKSHPDTAWTLANLAKTPTDATGLPLALQRADQAIAIYRSGAASQEPDHFARALEVRGVLEARSGDYQEARRSFVEALETRERIFGDAHPLTAEARVDLASADFQLGSAKPALENALAAEQTGREHLRFTIRYLPERQALEYAEKRPKGLDLAVSLVAAGTVSDSSPVADSVVQSRGVILDESGARVRAATASDPELASLNAAIGSARERFANLMLRSVQGEESVPRTLLDRTRQEKEDAERALAQRSVAVRTEFERANTRLADVQRSLRAGSALVSFIRYERTFLSNNKPQSNVRKSYEYGAFIIRSGPMSTQWVALGDATSLEALITQWRNEASGRSISSGVPAIQSESSYRTIGSRLRQRIWDPIAAHLDGVSQIFIVPDGSINLVSFAALPVNANQYLIETASVLHYLSTERDVISVTGVTGRGLLAVGGPGYDLQGRSPGPTATRRTGCGSAGVLRFEDLPGARAEVQDIGRIWSTSSPETVGAPEQAGDVTVLTGSAASKSAFLSASSGRRIVHLATHGFFLGSDCNSSPGTTRSAGGLVPVRAQAPLFQDSPLLLAGLAFAGANRHVASQSGRDDGILTAEEVAGLNLQGTEWVVLSACDTGLGEIRSGEGVFGLRRAFQIAGAHTIIMSLWSVEDQSTRNWMRALYEARFERHLSTADSVHEASVRMLNGRRTAGQSTHPFFWAAFVAAGDWK
jgi:CHAT domain-containing protein/tetratricopeptide (TPR) repeat protein